MEAEVRRKLKLLTLIEDFGLYPRSDVDSQHVMSLRWAIRSGCILPAPVVESKKFRIVDGFHRIRAYRAEFGEEHESEVIVRDYDSDGEIFQDAMRYNAAHGRNLSPFDRAHAALKARAFKLSTADIASALNTTSDAIEKLIDRKSCKVNLAKTEDDGGRSTELIPIKRTIAHMAGQVLNRAQVEINQHLTGARPIVHVNELITLIDGKLLDTKDQNLMSRLLHLADLVLELQPRTEESKPKKSLGSPMTAPPKSSVTREDAFRKRA